MKSVSNYLQRALCCLLLVPTLLLSACKGDAPDSGGGTQTNTGGGTTGGAKLEVVNNPEHIDFRPDAESRDVSVISSESGWRVREKVDVPWLEVSRVGSAIRIVVQENTAENVRTAQLLLLAGQTQKEVSVRQIGALPRILVSQSAISLPTAGGPVDFTVTTNVPQGFDIKVPEWMTNNEARAAMVETSHSYTASSNKTEVSRSANIEIVEKGATGREPIKAMIAVSQTGLGNYEGYSANKILEDVKLRIASGTASSHQPGSEITKAFDGDLSTIYHSAWANSATNYFPITLTFNLEQADKIDYMVYYPRQSGSNGHFKVVDIEYSLDGNSFTKFITKDFGGSSTPARVDFSALAAHAIKSVRLVVKSGFGDGQGFAAAAEVEFYKHNPKGFDPRSLFTDETCTTLRSDITEGDVQKCPDEFFRNLAFYMLQGKYSQEFRVDEYEAYPNPYNHIKTNKMQFAYSMLDNPTGIAVDAGETLVVLVGDTHGHENLSLSVVDFYQGGTGDGIYNQKKYPLNRGVNKLKMSAKGLVYVLYNKETISEATSARPIKIHIASGKVNGYFDTQNPKHQGRYTELLNKATHQYFDIMGLKSHLAMPTAVFRKVTPDGKELADLYDQIVHAEQELHGLIKYNRTYSNRMLLCPTYNQGAYMYATHEHTAYSPGTLEAVSNPSVLRNQVWGPAHEIGHVHQTVPAVLWQGMTECTVNIPSAYVQTTILGKECRLQVEDMGHNMSRYTRAFSNIIAKKIAHGSDTDVFRKLVPFWQLELYFGKVLGRTPTRTADKDGFYPQLYEHARLNQSPTRQSAGEYFNGMNQIEFVYIASKVSGYDLTDFFSKWGFLTPVDIAQLEDYDREPLKVTQAQIDAVKQRITALGLPKLDVALEFISDRTVSVFSSRAEIVKGTATRRDNLITLQGWSNVVAIEVLDANKNVVFIGDGTATNGSSYQDGYVANLSVEGVNWANGYSARAVSFSGKRVEITF